jgi:hypothetical protein
MGNVGSRTASVLALMLVTSVCWAEPLYFSGKLPDADGMERDVIFEGGIDGVKVAGTLRVEGNDMVVSGQRNDDGTLSLDIQLATGGSLGTVTLRPTEAPGRDAAASQTDLPLQASYELGGRTGAIAEIPSLDHAARAAVDKPAVAELEKRRATKPRISAPIPVE